MKGYDDIIGLAYEGVPGRPHMSLRDRAAQFAPFAALTGYDEVVQKSVTDASQEASVYGDEYY